MRTLLRIFLAMMFAVPPLAAQITPLDAGNESFARQIVPLVLGRRAKGWDEVKMLADLQSATNRRAVVRALTRDPAYVDQWSEVLVNAMRISRNSMHKPQQDCYGAPLLAQPEPALAAHVREHTPATAYAKDFNMADLVRASVALDDLSPIHRGHLFAMVSKPISGNEVTERTMRNDFGVAFGRVWTDRQMGCLKCHNSQRSVTATRTFAVRGAFERALWSPSFGTIDLDKVNALFRTDVATGGDVRPWNLATGCGTFTRELEPDNIDSFFISGRGRKASIWEMESDLARGIARLRQQGLVRTTRDNIPNTVEGDAAFAFLVAMNLVNVTWNEVHGSLLTIPISFPRTLSQHHVLRNLTEYRFVPSGWSLRTMIATAATDPSFNRKTPQRAGGDPYDLPPLFDPWLGAHPPVEPEKQRNAMTEGIHRYSTDSMLRFAHSALGWPAPERFPSDSPYPSAALTKALGRYYSDSEPGHNGVDFQGLLHWESVVGAGAPPEVANDWVDRVLQQTGTVDRQPLKVSDVVLTAKDWLVGETSISDEERNLLAQYFGVKNLSERVADAPDFPKRFRRYVGMLLVTPQFMLAGFASPELGPRPKLRVCMDGTCSYEQLCARMREPMRLEGFDLTCRANSLTTKPVSDPVRDALATICPAASCAILPVRAEYETATALNPPPPGCDPRYDGIMGCGRDLFGVDKRSVLVGWVGAGVPVAKASNVRIRKAKQPAFSPLTPGMTIAFGDVLMIPAGAQLEAGAFATPPAGMPAHPSGTAWVFAATGPLETTLAPLALMTDAERQDAERVLPGTPAWFGEAGEPLPLDEVRVKMPEQRNRKR